MSVLSDEWERKFRDDLAADTAVESRLFVKQIADITLVLALLLLRWMVL